MYCIFSQINFLNHKLNYCFIPNLITLTDFCTWTSSIKINENLNVITILRNFKNATFYVDYFLYWVDLVLFPIEYFILSRDKQQLTVKRMLSDRLFWRYHDVSHFQ